MEALPRKVELQQQGTHVPQIVEFVCFHIVDIPPGHCVNSYIYISTELPSHDEQDETN